MEFTPRIQQILRCLLNQDEYVKEQEIASLIGISKRTVQREFEYIGTELRSYGLTLERKKGAGVRLGGTASDKQQLRNILASPSGLDFSDKNQRQRYLLFDLLRDRLPKKLLHYSKLLGVSEATVASDMDAIGPWLAKNKLSILKKPGYGVILNGTEGNYREAMRRFISETSLYPAMEREDKHHAALATAIMNVSADGIYGLLNSNTLQRVTRVLEQLGPSKLQQFTDTAYMGLIIHIAIGVERISKGIVTKDSPKDSPCYEEDEDYHLAQRILQGIENEFHIQMPGIEIFYLLLHIKGSQIRYNNALEGITPSGLDKQETLRLIDTMIEAFDPQLAYELRCDDEFIRGLFIHLQPALVRLKNHLNIINPLLTDIEREYTDVFHKTAQAAAVIEASIGIPVSDEEIGYLTIHFGAALERLQGKQASMRRVSIGIICASGFGIARLMMARLANKLTGNVILHTYGKNEITDAIAMQTDFFVSSLPLENKAIDCVRISPLITQEDLARIRGKIAEYARIPKGADHTTQSVQDFGQAMGNTAAAAAEIASIIDKYHAYEIDKDTTFTNLIATVAGDLTTTERNSTLLQEDLLVRERLNSQIFAEQKFALLHCQSTAVTKPCFVTCSPAGGGSFTNAYFKNIRTVILMVMPDDENKELHRQVLGYISSSLVTDETFFEAIQGQTGPYIFHSLQRILKQYFNTLISHFT
ncbi:MAG: BglG family transcription antiterminator [Megasphaera sp.]|jgi:mannitol operon transcriptional antiterminator|nr:BglG family transcription antiterminator [Megasphaera sp.]MCH4188349.1 BglG family transcription antiterminator [Megasphaera sp.]MCH4218144.1 BglG family transcription antiterminator [Megasphaera sp.]